ncbi:SVM family protein [Candidatus Phytoplasma palmae]|uniref:SVM family protein n=1 Tax=Candidatus Phytoplasma palmae TaxID=85624 RepID=UPI003990CCE3
MFKIKKQFSNIIYICLISFIVLFFIISNDKVMAMDKNNSEIRKNKGKEICTNESSDDEEVDDFMELFQILKSAKQKIQQIREKHPHLKRSFPKEDSFKELEAAKILLDLRKGSKKRQKIDLNTIPEEK